MNIRKAAKDDLTQIEEIYNDIISMQESGNASVGWVRGVYPTYATAQGALERGELFVGEYNGSIAAAAIINQTQVPEYKNASWECADAADSEVMVLHTLVVSPKFSGKGFGTQFVDFYENYAKGNNCPHLRMDTNEINSSARKLYKKLGYTEADIVPCNFNGINGIHLVCLEKNLDI